MLHKNKDMSLKQINILVKPKNQPELWILVYFESSVPYGWF